MWGFESWWTMGIGNEPGVAFTDSFSLRVVALVSVHPEDSQVLHVCDQPNVSPHWAARPARRIIRLLLPCVSTSGENTEFIADQKARKTSAIPRTVRFIVVRGLLAFWRSLRAPSAGAWCSAPAHHLPQPRRRT